MTERSIALRRPPVLVQVEGRFVPEGVSLAEVDSAWSALCARNPRYFDGPTLQVLGVSRNGHGGVQIHVQESSYRFVAVAALGVDCGARPIGVKGVVRAGARTLMGRRSRSVAHYPGCWEFVPGGTLEPGETPEAAVVRELHEEARVVATTQPVAIALLFDPVVASWEIVYRIAIGAMELPATSWEYDEFRLAERAEAQAVGELSACARQILPFAFGDDKVALQGEQSHPA
jgi:ADP-ribose pyrophosphatase YjhB (NUDIX family)